MLFSQTKDDKAISFIVSTFTPYLRILHVLRASSSPNVWLPYFDTYTLFLRMAYTLYHVCAEFIIVYKYATLCAIRNNLRVRTVVTV